MSTLISSTQFVIYVWAIRHQWYRLLLDGKFDLHLYRNGLEDFHKNISYQDFGLKNLTVIAFRRKVYQVPTLYSIFSEFQQVSARAMLQCNWLLALYPLEMWSIQINHVYICISMCMHMYIYIHMQKNMCMYVYVYNIYII